MSPKQHERVVVDLVAHEGTLSAHVVGPAILHELRGEVSQSQVRWQLIGDVLAGETWPIDSHVGGIWENQRMHLAEPHYRKA
jgi:hypothetical protein